MHQIELPFENTIRLLFGEILEDELKILARSYFRILHHLIETSPNKCPAENIIDLVQIVGEEISRSLVNVVLDKCMVLIVQQNCSVFV